jgi:hypothetical protein
MINEDCDYEFQISDCEAEEIVEREHERQENESIERQATEFIAPEVPCENVLSLPVVLTERLSVVERQIINLQTGLDSLCGSSDALERILPYKLSNLESDLSIAFKEIRAVKCIFADIQDELSYSFSELRRDFLGLKREFENLKKINTHSDTVPPTITNFSTTSSSVVSSSVVNSSTVSSSTVNASIVKPITPVDTISTSSTPQSIPLTPPLVQYTSNPELIAGINEEMMLLHYSLHRDKTPDGVREQQQTPQPELDSEKTSIFAKIAVTI